jgi:hypothetical protein
MTRIPAEPVRGRAVNGPARRPAAARLPGLRPDSHGTSFCLSVVSGNGPMSRHRSQAFP